MPHFAVQSLLLLARHHSSGHIHFYHYHRTPFPFMFIHMLHGSRHYYIAHTHFAYGIKGFRIFTCTFELNALWVSLIGVVKKSTSHLYTVPERPYRTTVTNSPFTLFVLYKIRLFVSFRYQYRGRRIFSSRALRRFWSKHYENSKQLFVIHSTSALRCTLWYPINFVIVIFFNILIDENI